MLDTAAIWLGYLLIFSAGVFLSGLALVVGIRLWWDWVPSYWWTLCWIAHKRGDGPEAHRNLIKAVVDSADDGSLGYYEHQLRVRLAVRDGEGWIEPIEDEEAASERGDAQEARDE